MSVDEDPVEGRLVDALARLNGLEIRAQQGEIIPNDTIVAEVRAIRDDLLAERRATQKSERAVHARIDSLDERKVDKNPTAIRAWWVILTAIVGGVVAFAVGIAQGVGRG